MSDEALQDEYDELPFNSRSHPAVMLGLSDGKIEVLDREALDTGENGDGDVPDRRIIYSHDWGLNDEREQYHEYTIRIVNGETEKGGRDWTKTIDDSERSWGSENE